MNKINKILNELNPKFRSLNKYIENEIFEINNQLSTVSREDSLFSEKDTMLITYADQFQQDGKTHLETLKLFIEDDLENAINITHILPFYPWTSDDGFSPTDYMKVEPSYGSWRDIENLPGKKMFDCVFNHLSSESSFFKKALNGDKKYENMFHIVDETDYYKQDFQKNISKVVRPRTSPLFSPYQFKDGIKYVWTTFSLDQIDTNINNIDMIKYLLESFFLYIRKGAQYYRVDAVPFMWKDFGTNCSHRPKTHLFVQLLRAICDEIKNNQFIVTESNVPHEENITYWGNGENEAHIIYNFSLAPLILHGITFETNKYIHRWARDVFDIHPKTTFLNFTATHDGIGMRGLEGIVPSEDVKKLCEITEKKNGFVGKKQSRDGAVKPYELNITWASFMKEDELSEKDYINKVVNTHAIVMFFPGIGAHYVHNFLGSESWIQGRETSGIPRRVNREKLSYPLSYSETSLTIKNRLIELIKFKSSQPLFSPLMKIKMIETNLPVLAFERYNDHSSIKVMFNLTSKCISIDGRDLDPYELIFINQ